MGGWPVLPQHQIAHEQKGEAGPLEVCLRETRFVSNRPVVLASVRVGGKKHSGLLQ